MDVFQDGTCRLCGVESISQFFHLDNNSIEYNGTFLPLREILKESLAIKIDQKAGYSMDVCLDCKDQILKSYHFKRKVSEVQKIQQTRKTSKQRVQPRKAYEGRKIVQNMHQMIEIYARTHSIAAIRVEEMEDKIIFEVVKENSIEEDQVEDLEAASSQPINNITIKEEVPFVQVDQIVNEYDLMQPTYGEDDDGSDSWHSECLRNKKRKPTKQSKQKERKLQQNALSTKKIKLPIENERELISLSKELAENAGYREKLGNQLVNSLKSSYDGEVKKAPTIIRSMLKLVLGENVLQNMNLSGKMSKIRMSLSKGDPIKTPPSFLKFIAKYSSTLIKLDEKKTSRHVKKVISRWMSDSYRDRKTVSGRDHNDDDDDGSSFYDPLN